VALKINDTNCGRIEDLEGENSQVKDENASLQMQNAANQKSVGSLTKENKELSI